HLLAGRPDDARDLLEGAIADAADPRLSFALAEVDEGNSAPDAVARYEARLREVLASSPTALPARLRLARSLLARGAADSARIQLEEVRRIPPEPPQDAAPHLAGALEAIDAGDAGAALAALDQFNQAMETTAPYQASVAELGWV